MSGRPSLRWCAPYALMLGVFAIKSFLAFDGPEWLGTLANLGVLVIPLVVPVVGAVVDGRRDLFWLLLGTTWASLVPIAMLLALQAERAWAQRSFADMGMILLPFVAGWFVVCSLVAALAFFVAHEVRKRRS